MGSMITLSLNGVDIDWGKNRYWHGHHWLFPPGALTHIDYRYAGDVIETKPGFHTTLDEACFRLRHLGYSQHEAKTKFEKAVTRWNRTGDLHLSFADFRRVLTSIDFGSLTWSALASYDYDFRTYVVSLLAAWDTDGAMLDDFVASLDVALTLRLLAERVENRSLPLRWHHQDLIDGGWASLDDLTDIDRRTFIINHTMLIGRLQDHAGATTVSAFDAWLANQGLPQATSYLRIKPDGTAAHETLTLPSAVRNMIHHPENPHNALSDNDLRESVELLLGIAKFLPSPLPGLT